MAYINFEEQKHLRTLFASDLDVKRILFAIETETGTKCVSGKTLLFFDEIQEATNGLTVLKYFQDNMPEQHIIVAGSLLGIELHKKESFLVGNVDFMRLYPLDFLRFCLLSASRNCILCCCAGIGWALIKTFSGKLKDRLRQYLSSYDNDFSKHAPNEMIPRIRQVWNSIPAQLSRGNR